MKKKMAIVTILIVLLIGLGLLVYQMRKEPEQEIKETELEEITKIKEELGIQGDVQLYEIDTEYDGRKVLAIKPEIQYKVIMAGILNQGKPKWEEVDNIVEQNSPKNAGIWISEKARDEFLAILKSITECKYSINEQGYLEQQDNENLNGYDKKIQEILENGKQYSIDIDSKYYIVDQVTGEIVEEPFEQMDPRTPYEYFELKDKSIYIITTNSKEKLNKQDILQEILENVQ